MAFTVGTTVVSGTNAGGKTSQVVTLGSTTVGDLNVIELVGTTITTSAPTVTTPTGWTKIGEHSQSASSTPYVGIFYRFFQTGDASSVTISWTGAMTVEVYCTPVTGADTTTPVPSSSLTFTNRSGTTTTDTAAGTTADAGYLWFGFCNKNGTTAYSAMSDTARNAVTYSSSITSATRMETASNASGHTYSKTATAASSSIGFGWAYVVAPAATGSTAATGSAALDVTAAGGATGAVAGTASITVAGSAGGPIATGAAGITLTAAATSTATATGTAAIALGATASSKTPAQLWVSSHSGGTQYVAHRDGSWVANGEETLEGYTATAAYSSVAALEISVNDTSDGVWVCSHDSTTGRVFTGSNLTITSTAWSTFSPNGAFVTTGRPTTLVGSHPMRRLEEILDAFPDRIFVIDNKHNFNHASLIAVLQAHCPGRWLAKQYFSGYAWLNAASAYGAPCWAYFYPTDLGSLSTTYTNLAPAIANGVQIIYGIGDFSLTGASLPVQSDVTTFFTYTTAHSIMAWPHILSAASQKATADGYAATAGASFNGYMMSNLANTVAGDSTGTGSGTSSIAVAAGATPKAAASGSASLGIAAGTAVAQASVLTATATVTIAGGPIAATAVATASNGLGVATNVVTAVAVSSSTSTGLTIAAQPATTSAQAVAAGALSLSAAGIASTGAAFASILLGANASAVGQATASNTVTFTAQAVTSTTATASLGLASGTPAASALQTGAAALQVTSTPATVGASATAASALSVDAAGIASVVTVNTASGSFTFTASAAPVVAMAASASISVAAPVALAQARAATAPAVVTFSTAASTSFVGALVLTLVGSATVSSISVTASGRVVFTANGVVHEAGVAPTSVTRVIVNSNQTDVTIPRGETFVMLVRGGE